MFVTQMQAVKKNEAQESAQWTPETVLKIIAKSQKSGLDSGDLSRRMEDKFNIIGYMTPCNYARIYTFGGNDYVGIGRKAGDKDEMEYLMPVDQPDTSFKYITGLTDLANLKLVYGEPSFRGQLIYIDKDPPSKEDYKKIIVDAELSVWMPKKQDNISIKSD